MLKPIRTAALAAGLTVLGFVAVEAATPPQPAPPATQSAIPMKKDGGVFVVPVSVNGIATFDCIVDSGASDVNIPTDVFRKLQRAGTVSEADFVGTQEYTLADGSTQRGRTYRVKALRVGNVTVNNVLVSVGGDSDSGLLGQSFLERFRSWSLNNTNHTLVLMGPPTGLPVGSDHRPPQGHIAPDPGQVAQAGPSAHGTPRNNGNTGSPRGNQGDAVSVAQVGGNHGGDRDPSSEDHLTAQKSDDGDDY
ncbi:MAG: retroviral-like aspartic protease family protein [Alphaproteobacteria bacterium]|nr:retroviral-like aspartic protease family protein [Alphaproteobacteria bacterium]